MVRCPNCGQRFEVVRLPLTSRQIKILDAITSLKRSGQRTTSRRIAVEVGVSSATIRNELPALEAQHYVHRPCGVNSGYEVQEPDGIKLVPISSWAA